MCEKYDSVSALLLCPYDLSVKALRIRSWFQRVNNIVASDEPASTIVAGTNLQVQCADKDVSFLPVVTFFKR